MKTVAETHHGPQRHAFSRSSCASASVGGLLDVNHSFPAEADTGGRNYARSRAQI